MSPFLRAVLARLELEHEERIVAAPAKALPVERTPARPGRCECGEPVLLGRGQCRACLAASAVGDGERRQVSASDVVAVVRRYYLGATVRDVSEGTGLSTTATYRALLRGVTGGYLRRVDTGRYAVADLSRLRGRRLAQSQDAGT